MWDAYPGLPAWANLCRPYGAGMRRGAILVLIFDWGAHPDGGATSRAT
jgi:hypothetical protein